MKSYSYVSDLGDQIYGTDYSLSYGLEDYNNLTFDFTRYLSFHRKDQLLVEILGWRVFKK